MLALAAVPAWIAAAHELHQVTLVQGVAGGAIAGILLGLIAIGLARGARVQVERTLARVGERTARAGTLLGTLGLLLGLTAAIALGFFALLVYLGR